MNQETIPDNNLPVFLQKYDVNILDDKKESVGKVLYTTTGAIPSNKKEKRVWQLNLTGYLKPNVDTYHIVYNFSEVDYKYKENISFENIVSGTFNICGQVLDASKIIGFDYTYSDADSTLTIKLHTSKWDFRLKKESLFSYQLNVDDASTCPSSATCSAITTSDYTAINTSSTTTATLTNGDKLSYTDTFRINNDLTTIYGIYMDFIQTTGSSYFTLSSLYVNSCTEGNISCAKSYDVSSYSNSSGDTVSGIMIPSDSSDGYVPTTITISTLNISLLFYVNSSSEYYFVATTININDYEEINLDSSTIKNLNNLNGLYYNYSSCNVEAKPDGNSLVLNAVKFKGVLYSIFLTLEKSTTSSSSYYKISSLYGIISCISGIDCDGDVLFGGAVVGTEGLEITYSNSSGIDGIIIPSASSSSPASTDVSISYTYKFSDIQFTYNNKIYTASLDGTLSASFATFTVNSDGEYYATISDSSDSICNQTFEIKYTLSSASS
jgi:hypothetical protein